MSSNPDHQNRNPELDRQKAKKVDEANEVPAGHEIQNPTRFFGVALSVMFILMIILVYISWTARGT